MNAYVESHIKTVEKNLRRNRSFVAREIYVDIPIAFEEGDKRPAPTDFHATFDGINAIVRIWGEGGTGKTTLAYQLALWAVANQRYERLCYRHRMIPVIIETNIPGAKPGDSSSLLKVITGNLRLLIDEKESPSEELVKNLLKHGFILVVVDGLTELDENTRSIIRPNDDKLPLNALIVTSRTKDSLDTADSITLKTGLLKGSAIADFIEDYLKKYGFGSILTDNDFYHELQRFMVLVDNREITALMAQLYAQHLIDRRGNDQVQRPKNVPELIDTYVTRMCDQVALPEYPVQVTYPLACKIAWACLEESLTPIETPIKKIREHLIRKTDDISLPTAQDDPDIVISVFTDLLRLLQRPYPTASVIKFNLDPLSEYLAARYLVSYWCREDSTKWRDFFDLAERKSGAPESVAGFLRALADTVQNKGHESNVPDFVLTKINAIMGAASRNGL